MFTGLVEAVARVTRRLPSSGGALLAVERPARFADAAEGESVAVSGVCLTVRGDSPPGELLFDVSPETLRRSTLGSLAPGGRVNLERALRADARLGGHVVAGHVDATAAVTRLTREGGFWTLGVALDDSWSRYVVEKGSVALDGISLTVASLTSRELEVAVIPATWAATTLADRRTGDLLNVEVDVLAKYVERLVAGFVGSGRDERLRRLLDDRA